MTGTLVRKLIPIGLLFALVFFALPKSTTGWSTSPTIQVGRGETRTNWAVVNDSGGMKTTLTLTITSLITKAAVAYYPNCETALAGPIHQVYLVDYEMGAKVMKGTECVQALRAKAPTALIVGLTQISIMRDQFFKFGADAFDDSVGDPIGVIKKILKLK